MVGYQGSIWESTTRLYLGTAEEHMVYKAELAGIMLGIDMVQKLPEVQGASIVPDSQAAIKVAAKGHNNGANSLLFKAIKDELENLHHKHEGANITVQWTSRHLGIKGNEAVNGEAKKAAGRDGSPPDQLPASLCSGVPKSMSTLRKTYKVNARKQQAHTFKQLPQYKKMYRIDPSAPSSKFRKMVEELGR